VDDLGSRLRQPACHDLLKRRIGAAGIFVKIVAEVDPHIEIIARGGMAISVEEAEADIGAGEDRGAKAAGAIIRQCPRAADG